jgi:flagellar hook assembly protein FlgD
MSRGGALVLAALALATVVAAVIVQRAKDAPALVRQVTVTRTFSPDGDGVADRARIGLEPGRRDRVSLTILDARGRAVRHLVRGRRKRAGRRLRARWDGRTDAGTRAPAGVYRVRVDLPRRGRDLVLVDTIRLRAGAAG